ncbi:MAG TPA: hypothetical protein VHC22_23580 [Pirellulales bacterium]|nr:hypothetical protein [Pirellulales bacterium]
MDQVKVYLGVAKKHHFWILVTIVVITATIVWVKASSTLASKYDSDKRTITGAQDSVQKASSPDSVNASFSTKVDKLHDDLKISVFEAWKKLYERQASLFVWPDLSAVDQNIDLNKIGPEEEIPIYIRTYYNERVVGPLWKGVLEQINLRQPKVQPLKEEGDEEEEEEAEKRGVEYEGLVVWKQSLRDEIAARYYTRNAVPSTVRLRLTQEDLWLFESLVQVVNTVNTGATDSLKAPIKEILTLDVAQWAVVASLESGSTIWTPGTKGAAGSPMSANNPMAAATAPTGPGAGATGAAAAAGGANEDAEWVDNRYLDDKGEPLKGTNHPFAEFKQMFVYMKYIMDQRRIPELVAACANAPLPIETRQIKVQMLKSDSGSGGGGGLFGNGATFGGGMPSGMGGGGMGGSGMPAGAKGGMGSGGMGAGGMPPNMGGRGGMPAGMQPPRAPAPPGMGMMGGAAMGMDAGSPMGGADMGGMAVQNMVLDGGVETTIYDAVVELSGVIYLYRPPDIAKLGTGSAGSPDKRSFGVPTTTVPAPGASGGGGVKTMMPTAAPKSPGG